MSWFNLGVSKEELERQEEEFKRKYGIVTVKRDDDDIMIPTIHDHDHDEESEVTTILDNNIDEKFDYSDFED